jgi:hypothetical protein
MMTPIGDESGFLNNYGTGLPLLISPIRKLDIKSSAYNVTKIWRYTILLENEPPISAVCGNTKFSNILD